MPDQPVMTKSRLHFLQNQIRRLSTKKQQLKAQNNRFSGIRLGIFLVGAGAGIAAYYLIAPSVGWTLFTVTFLAFNIVAFYHRRIVRSIRRHAIWLALKRAQVARMQLDWPNIPLQQHDEPDPDHPFEVDLDITGRHSLHHLLDTTISRDGSQQLKQWLLTTNASKDAILERQSIVAEMAPLSRFRDKLYLAYRLIAKEPLEGRALVRALQKHQTPGHLSWVLAASAGFALLNITLYLMHSLQVLPAWWIFSLSAYGIIYFLNQGMLDSLLGESVFISEQLKKLKAILYFLESYPYGNHPHLENLCRPFWAAASKPSAILKQTTLFSFAVGLRMNPMLRLVFNLLGPWDFYLARLLGSLKNRLENRLDTWFQALVQLEALNALANFAYLQPNCTFPKLTSSKQPFKVTGLGHPLISQNVRRYNDFSMESVGDVALITGSNMSGKSTFLKTLGINLALAFAGGPVIAKEFNTRPYRLFSCIQINDSITDGFSFFYAEVRRLKMLLQKLDMQNELPLFFLIDEIFKGTNNRERLIGSQSYIQALAGRNGLGAISTHDLELTSLDKQIPEITNFHFREEVVNGKMVFDYQMRPGPCPSTNALKIMKMEGLPVGRDPMQ